MYVFLISALYDFVKLLKTTSSMIYVFAVV